MQGKQSGKLLDKGFNQQGDNHGVLLRKRKNKRNLSKKKRLNSKGFLGLASLRALIKWRNKSQDFLIDNKTLMRSK